MSLQMEAFDCATETLSKGLGQVVLDMKVAPKRTQLLPHGDTDPNGEVKQRGVRVK